MSLRHVVRRSEQFDAVRDGQEIEDEEEFESVSGDELSVLTSYLLGVPSDDRMSTARPSANSCNH